MPKTLPDAEMDAALDYIAAADVLRVCSTTADNVTVTVGAPTLDVHDALQGQTVESPALTQLHLLTVADAAQGQTADDVILAQIHHLAVADLTQSQTIDTVAIGDLPPVVPFYGTVTVTIRGGP